MIFADRMSEITQSAKLPKPDSNSLRPCFQDITRVALQLHQASRVKVVEGEIMFEGLLQPMHLLVILVVGLFVFGPKKLPELGKGLAEGIRGFKDALNGNSNDSEKK
jgi:sec-independent protein translocase protein TatA